MTHTYTARIHVTLRPSVLDPVGTALEQSLHQLGYEGVAGVRVGKFMTLCLTSADRPTAEQQVQAMCQQLLANPVIEDYSFELTEAPSGES